MTGMNCMLANICKLKAFCLEVSICLVNDKNRLPSKLGIGKQKSQFNRIFDVMNKLMFHFPIIHLNYDNDMKILFSCLHKGIICRIMVLTCNYIHIQVTRIGLFMLNLAMQLEVCHNYALI